MKQKYLTWFLFIGLLVIFVLFAAFYALNTGELDIALKDVVNILQSKKGIEYSILTKIRLPRIVLAFSIGGALSLTGTLLQGIYRNPLVEPYTLGISGGAALGVALAIVFGLTAKVGAYMLPVSGFAGALITIFLVYFLGVRKGGLNINRMLLIGVMISFIASSAMMFLMSVTTSENTHSIIFWTMGSLDEPNVMLIRIMLIISISGLALSYLFARPLNALRLGEAKAKHLGVNSSVAIQALFVIASLLTGICVSVAGVIGFVGLIIPHLVRIIIGSDYRILLVSSFLGGSLFLIVCDIIARTIISPNELPIGVITGIVGGIVFIFVLSRSGFKSKMS